MARKPADQSVHREDIIRAAAEVLQRNGYEAATMKDIAAAVNLTAASLYHHFRNKDTLLLAVLELGLDAVTREIEPIIRAEQPSDKKLRAMICAHVVALTENTAVGAAMVFEIRALMHVKAPTRNASAEDREAYQAFVDRRSAFFARRDHFEDLFRAALPAHTRILSQPRIVAESLQDYLERHPRFRKGDGNDVRYLSTAPAASLKGMELFVPEAIGRIEQVI